MIIACDEAIKYYDRFSDSLDVEDLNMCLIELRNQMIKEKNVKRKWEIVKYMSIVKEVRDEFIRHELI